MIEVDYQEKIIIKIELVDEDAKNFIQEITSICLTENNQKYLTMYKINQELSNK